mmetsp:Transcript_9732/g.17670  ORF Transcript_9732/g.17670 Transcript_9732/m.17670 type:complete len:255 (-) Transcript_9732:697-1461(-)
MACSSAWLALTRLKSVSSVSSLSRRTWTIVSSWSSLFMPPTSSRAFSILSCKCLIPALTEMRVVANLSYLPFHLSKTLILVDRDSSLSSTIFLRWPPPEELYLISSTFFFKVSLLSVRDSTLAWFSFVSDMRFAEVPSCPSIFLMTSLTSLTPVASLIFLNAFSKMSILLLLAALVNSSALLLLPPVPPSTPVLMLARSALSPSPSMPSSIMLFSIISCLFASLFIALSYMVFLSWTTWCLSRSSVSRRRRSSS